MVWQPDKVRGAARYKVLNPERLDVEPETVNASAEYKHWYQWRMQRVSKGGPKFRHNPVTSRIKFMRSAECKTILGWSGGMPRENFAKLHL